MYFSTALIAYIIDYFFAEFEKIKFLKHPIIFIGDYIKWFEKRFYLDNIYRGFILTLSLLCIVFSITYIFTLVDNVLFQGFLCSFAISSKMLYESVKNVINSSNPKYAISMLVSRDTKEMKQSEINKAAIETYAENLSDGVIAPLFYMICFGLVGAFIYKAINTLDSMVGYRNEKYENFGKVSARLDDIANYIPARITALLIALLFLSKKAFLNFNKYGKKHESLNAGLPISAIALALDLKLGGPTSYFGKIKDKPYFGEGKEEITKEDVKKALNIKIRIDIFILFFLSLFTIFSY
ncbi:adenosylcobinamide-phosphate synthase CbiB [Halarcobacter ebronensis]|uniref:Cobalamin biosynthesis protein CobD n=1 Tax=Halarcobacter ebronensis TaxID=1462615 RepID=A0A4V1M046_9BACT|nr:adenosylcobinamide-phosphate synthase CbiB [Halarcobacter ebronensis]QKF82162.1 adenosylcobinamide-phosphate synthase [Halarcobacter ebronensis]RXK03459.1 cobalamin biosynthesis protein CobD [Halarcobacter ebronensis]